MPKITTDGVLVAGDMAALSAFVRDRRADSIAGLRLAVVVADGEAAADVAAEIDGRPRRNHW